MANEALTPYAAETERMILRFREVFADLAELASDDDPKTQKSHTLTAFIRALCEEGLDHLKRPEAIAWLVNTGLNDAVEARAKLAAATPAQRRLT